MRIKLAICDDEQSETEYITRLVQSWAAKSALTADVYTFDSSEAFLFTYDADKSFDILLLDIQMKQMDGVELAKELRADGAQMQIVFITGFPDFIAEGYDVSALHYLMKPVSKEKLTEVLDKAVQLLGAKKTSLLLKIESGQTRVFCDDITYVEAFAHNVVVYTTSEIIEVKESISALETALAEDFCRVHRSYIVGLRHIRQISKTVVYLDDGAEVPLSRRRYDTLNKAFISYHRGDAQ